MDVEVDVRIFQAKRIHIRMKSLCEDAAFWKQSYRTWIEF